MSKNSKTNKFKRLNSNMGYVYAIREKDSELYYSRNHSLSPLGYNTVFFSSEDKAINAMFDFNPDIGFSFNPIRRQLAIKQLANLKNEDLWNMDITREELKAAEAEVGQLEVCLIKLIGLGIEYE